MSEATVTQEVDVPIAVPAAGAEVDAQPEPSAVTGAAQPEPETDKDLDEKPKGGFQRRIDKLTKDLRSKEIEAAELRGRLKERELHAEPAKKPSEPDPEPQPDDFKTYEEYVKAMSRFIARQEAKAITAETVEKTRAEAAKADSEARESEVMADYQKRVRDFTAEHDDYAEVVNDMRLEQDIAPSVELAIIEDDNGPALAYYLATHPDIQDRMNQMSAAGAVRYLGRVAERLFPETADDGEPKPASVSTSLSAPKPAAARRQPPEPISPTRKSAPTDKGLSDDLPVEEWAKRYRKDMGYDK